MMYKCLYLPRNLLHRGHTCTFFAGLGTAACEQAKSDDIRGLIRILNAKHAKIFKTAVLCRSLGNTKCHLENLCALCVKQLAQCR